MDQNKSKTTSADFFIYLGIIIGLYVSAVSLISLAFDLIAKWLPDVGSYSYFSSEGIRFSIAALIIFFPAYIYLSKLSTKAVALVPEKKDLWVRHWFFFLTLFITGLAIAVDLSTLVYNFIGGEDLTLRFTLKVLVVLIVAVAVFRFYLYELRRDVTLPTPKRKYLSYTASTVILAAIVVGIWSIGSPTTQRNIRFDQQRVNDLSSIQSALVGYYLDNNVLPKDLSILAQATTYYVSSLKDPETKDNYEYSVLYVNKYRLCANFASDNLGGDLSTQQVYPTNLDLWTHGIGRTCFDFTAGEIKGVQASPHSLI